MVKWLRQATKASSTLASAVKLASTSYCDAGFGVSEKVPSIRVYSVPSQEGLGSGRGAGDGDGIRVR